MNFNEQCVIFLNKNFVNADSENIRFNSLDNKIFSLN